jgi:hypothetical protein
MKSKLVSGDELVRNRLLMCFLSDIIVSDELGETLNTEPTPDPELVEVFDTMQESEAMVVHGLLTSAGIESAITNTEAAQDIFPGVGGISVRVNPAQEQEARRLINDYRANPASEEDSTPADDATQP